MFGTSTGLPPSGEKQFRKICQNLEQWLYIYIYASFGYVKSQKCERGGRGREVPQSFPTFIDGVAPPGLHPRQWPICLMSLTRAYDQLSPLLHFFSLRVYFDTRS